MNYAPWGCKGPLLSNFMLGIAIAATPHLVNGMLAVWQRHRRNARCGYWHNMDRRLAH